MCVAFVIGRSDGSLGSCVVAIMRRNNLQARVRRQGEFDSLTVDGAQLTNLVDPASSDMLVSKIKPCMSEYKLLYCETANGSLKQL